MPTRHQALSNAVLAVLLAVGVSLGTAQARDLSVDAEDLVAVELATVALDPRSGQPVVVLREPESGDVLLISVGPNQGRAIVQALRGQETRRPMTHDLLRDVVGALDGEVVRVMVDSLSEGTYFGILELQPAGDGDPVRLDSRPSDALALAARTGAQIRVAPELLSGAAEDYRGFDEHEVVNTLGITVVEATPALREALELPDTPGVLVSRATGDAAAAGMAPGSLILSINGAAPASPLDFLRRVRAIDPEEQADIRFWHEGEEREVSLDTGSAREQRRPRSGIEL